MQPYAVALAYISDGIDICRAVRAETDAQGDRQKKSPTERKKGKWEMELGENKRRMVFRREAITCTGESEQYG